MGYFEYDDYNPDDVGYFGADADELSGLVPPLPAVASSSPSMAESSSGSRLDAGTSGEVGVERVADVEVHAEGEAVELVPMTLSEFRRWSAWKKTLQGMRQ